MIQDQTRRKEAYIVMDAGGRIEEANEEAARLRRARDDLEQRVRERTAALEASNQQKDRLVEELRRANEAKDEFLGLLSHELRTSMTLIYGGVQAVRRMGDRIGAVVEGMEADLVATAGNPLDDITAVRRVDFVMKSGKVVKETAR